MHLSRPPPRRFKSYFNNGDRTSNFDYIFQIVVEECDNINLEEATACVAVATKKKKSGLAAILKPSFSSETTKQNTCSVVEVERYKSSPDLDLEDDPLQWWKINSNVYPRLAQLALKYLTIPATSVPSERVFSRGGNIITDTRGSLTNQHASELVFLGVIKKLVPI